MMREEYDNCVRHWLKVCYTYAAVNSDDRHTKNGAVILPQLAKDGAVILPNLDWSVEPIGYGANRFPDGVAVTKERLAPDVKGLYMLHAEETAILDMAYRGTAQEGPLTMVACWAPCDRCARQIIDVGITELIVHKAMHDRTPDRWRKVIEDAIEMLGEAGVSYRQWDGEVGGGIVNLFDGIVWRP